MCFNNRWLLVHKAPELLSWAYLVIRFNETFRSSSQDFFLLMLQMLDHYNWFISDKREEKYWLEILMRVKIGLDVRENLSSWLCSRENKKENESKGPFNYCPTLMKHKKLIMLSAGSLLCILLGTTVTKFTWKGTFSNVQTIVGCSFSALRERQQPDYVWLDAVYVTYIFIQSLYILFIVQTDILFVQFFCWFAVLNGMGNNSKFVNSFGWLELKF